MVDSVYPPSLPCPKAAPFVPADRVRRSDLPGLMQFSGNGRDFRGSQEVTFTLSALEAETFHEWWRDTLSRGGYWFSTTNWPLPPGWSTVAVRRFTNTPKWSAIGKGYWSVTAQTEVRGASLLPQLPTQYLFRDTFTGPAASIEGHTPDIPPESGWTSYVDVSGVGLFLTGSGGVISGNASDSRSDASGLSLDMPSEFRVTLIVDVQAQVGFSETNWVRLHNTVNGGGLELHLGPLGGGGYGAIVRVGQVGGYALDVTFSAAIGTHTLSVVFGNGVAESYLDGTLRRTDTFVASALPVHVNQIQVACSAEPGALGVIDEISISLL